MKYPKSGSFKDFTLHELAIHMIKARYSGSLEVDYAGNTLRIFQFDKGNLCAASSNAEEEQLDNIIRADRDPQLSKEQKAYLQERLDTGMKYGKALVETALMSASELLTYNSKQATAILAGALRENPLEYRTERGNAGQYRPLPIDPYTTIRKSILTDISADIVSDMLGDENTAYMKGDNISGGSKALQADEEIRAILSHLDGRRSIREIAARIGLNPDRTSRMLLLLKMMEWIEPAVGGEEEFAEDRYLESPDRLVGATAEVETTGKDFIEENEDILQLLGSEDAHVDLDTRVDYMPPLEHNDSVALTSDPVKLNPEIPARPAEPEKEGFRGVLARRDKQGKGGKLLKIALPLAIAFIVVAIVSAGLLIGSSKSPANESKDLSFYPPEVEQEQLPLDKDFTEAKEVASNSIRIDLQDDQQQQPANKASDESKPATDDTDYEPKSPATTPENEPQYTEPETVKTSDSVKDDKPVDTSSVNNTTVKPQYQDREMEDQKTENASSQPKDTRSFDEIQPIALDRGFRGNWNEAAQLWSGPISAMNGSAYTLLIKRTQNSSDVSSVFERFANSSRMRNEFFVVKRGETFFVCWGFFPENAAAENALHTLPTRISQYRPAVRHLDDVLP